MRGVGVLVFVIAAALPGAACGSGSSPGTAQIHFRQIASGLN
jgi:hypothetical protein